MSVRMKDCENERRNECEGVRVTPPMSVPNPNEKGGGAPFTEKLPAGNEIRYGCTDAPYRVPRAAEPPFIIY